MNILLSRGSCMFLKKVPAELLGKFTDEQIGTFRQLFEYYDSDGSGAISPDELARVLKELGESTDPARLELLIKEGGSRAL